MFGGQKWSGFGWKMPACNQAPALKMFYCLWKIYRLLFSVVFRSVLFFEFMFRFVRRIMNFRDSLKILINPILNGMFIRSYPKPYTKYTVSYGNLFARKSHHCYRHKNVHINSQWRAYNPKVDPYK